MVIGSCKEIKVFSNEAQYCSSLKCYGNKQFDFEIRGIQSHDCHIIIFGRHQCTLIKISFDGETLVLEDVSSMTFDRDILSAKLSEDRIVILFDYSIEIYSLMQASDIVKLSSVSKLLDITICESDNSMIFALDNQGWI